MRTIETEARKLVEAVVEFVAIVDRERCTGIELDKLGEMTNAMMNCGKALDEGRVQIPAGGSAIDREIDASRRAEGKPDLSRVRQHDEFDHRFPPEDAASVRVCSRGVERRLRRAMADNSPGQRIEDERLDPLVHELSVILGEIVHRQGSVLAP